VLEAIRKLKLKNSKNHFCIIAVYLPTYNCTGIWNYTTFETTCKASCAVQYLTSVITLKARASVPDQCKIDDIGRGMGLRSVTSRLLTRGHWIPMVVDNKCYFSGT